MNSYPLSSYLLPLVVSMLPIAELRGGLPLALSQGVSPWQAYFLSVMGNTLPVLPLLIGLRAGMRIVKRFHWPAGILQAIQGKTLKKKRLVQKYGIGGIIILVAIPLPITGAWTGSLVSTLLSIPVKYAFPAIFAGICTAGLIVLLVTLGILGIVGIFGGM